VDELRIVFICAPGRESSVDFLSKKQVAAVERQIFGISNELALKGHEVFIIRRWSSDRVFEVHNGICFVNIPQSYPFLKKGEEDSLSFLEALSSFLVHFVYSFKALKKIRTLRPDVVNISSILLGFFTSGFIKAPKVFVTHTHDFYVHDTPYRHLKELIVKVALANFDEIIALTPSIKKYLERMSIKVGAVIPNGLDLGKYDIEIHNDNLEPLVLYAGRLAKHKRVIDLLESFSSINVRVASKLIIIGEGPEKSNLVEWVNHNNSAQEIGFLPFLSQEEYRRFLSKCSLFVLPSTTEAFGVVVIEAMASRKPVIARNVMGPMDIITQGQEGFLFQTNHELSEYMELLLSNEVLRRKMGSKGRATVESKYTFGKVSEEYMRIYESLFG
jgi:glycosyltransferase involved in cell wall biosynthesis